MGKILERIASPQDLKKLPRSLLYQVAQEIRQEIVRVVSVRGGHLASSLGAVELAIALHYCFDAPRDKILWDVGHQAYAHKILTGRRESFNTLRQKGGLSGFLRREESPFDVYDSGHSGSALALSLGIAEARDLRGEDFHVVAVIGDGSLSAGVTFEALNCAGAWGTKLIVVLNDNEMSISKTVGALSGYLTRILTGHWATKMKEDIKRILQEIPGGKRLFRIMKTTEEAIKAFFSPGLLFEELGFKYIGPIDGHNLDHLIDTLNNVKQLNRPVLLHVVTKKGKGYPPAEGDPTSFHGVEGFDPQTGFLKKDWALPTFSEVFGETLIEIAESDPRVVAITAAMPSGTGLLEFSKRFPNRFFDVGIAEQAAVSLGAGLALCGFKPFVAIYSCFLQRAYDQIVEEVSLQKLPVVFCIDRAGIVGEDGETHHGLFDLSYLRSIPNMTLMAPKDEWELREMLFAALKYDKGPVAIRYPKAKGLGEFFKTKRPFEWVKMEILKEGQKLLILAVGSMVQRAFLASEALEREMGIKPTVVNVRFIKPLDEVSLRALVKDHQVILTLEENVLEGGFGSAVLEFMAKEGFSDKKVKCVGLPSRFIEHGPREELLKMCGLDVQDLVQDMLKLLEKV